MTFSHFHVKMFLKNVLAFCATTSQNRLLRRERNPSPQISIRKQKTTTPYCMKSHHLLLAYRTHFSVTFKDS
ncbi:unnamed protein product [Acanthoscelides obtectus]|uniref:Uncharacterized protein n=1 Tax=Acanthoscelides obtectus TaxID=200917 RepID=A0A9P0P9P0_ACAOB|nr:unnamed protein product [Acanthoscelides obtectus]CAK1623660.1 hypothetical protein AOBTE_LOCUS2110 [Acanthoscelides obtectus]